MKIVPEEQFMAEAIKEAQKAYQSGDYAIGAVIVKNGKIIARGTNQSKIKEDPTCHAEMVVIRKAAKKLVSRHLKGCVLYTTCEPCPMCSGTAILAMLDGVVSGATGKDMGNHRIKKANGKFLWRNFNVSAEQILKSGIPRVPIITEFMREECIKLFHD